MAASMKFKSFAPDFLRTCHPLQELHLMSFILKEFSKGWNAWNIMKHHQFRAPLKLTAFEFDANLWVWKTHSCHQPMVLTAKIYVYCFGLSSFYLMYASGTHWSKISTQKWWTRQLPFAETPKWSNKYSYCIGCNWTSVVWYTGHMHLWFANFLSMMFVFLILSRWAWPFLSTARVCQGHLWLLGSAGLPNHRPMAGWWIRICCFFPRSARQGSLCRNGDYNHNACKSSLFQRYVIWVNTLLWAYHGVITLSSGGCHFWSDGITKVFW